MDTKEVIEAKDFNGKRIIIDDIVLVPYGKTTLKFCKVVRIRPKMVAVVVLDKNLQQVNLRETPSYKRHDSVYVIDTLLDKLDSLGL